MKKRLLSLLFVLAMAATAATAVAQDATKRGQYLVAIMDCGGCHTDGALAGKPDPALQLAGSGIGFGAPGSGSSTRRT